MSSLELNKTKNTPEVKAEISEGNGMIIISGNSFPENAQKFYTNLIDWLNSNKPNINQLEVICDYNYMASSSLICFLDVLRTAIKNFGDDNCKVLWKYEEDDDDVLKIGKDFDKILACKIEFEAY